MSENIDLKFLGITEEDLQEKLIELMCDRLLCKWQSSDDGELYGQSPLMDAIRKQIKEHIDREVERLGKVHVLPKVTDMIENLVLQKTNSWGEKIGEPITFTEYLVQRAEHYMLEKVDTSGRSQQEAKRDGYSWSPSKTRIDNLVGSHLHRNIETAMKAVIKNANETLVNSIEKTIKIQLEEISKKMSARVSFKG